MCNIVDICSRDQTDQWLLEQLGPFLYTLQTLPTRWQRLTNKNAQRKKSGIKLIILYVYYTIVLDQSPVGLDGVERLTVLDAETEQWSNLISAKSLRAMKWAPRHRWPLDP